MSRKEMFLIGKEELNRFLESKYQEGVLEGVQLMKERMLLACQNGTPIELNNGRGYFVQNDIEHLRQVIK